ncbi:MAG: HDOD domain-containing protein, partial [Planctomycetes bacterium]|nr:HDOD domain-containing protein [Planctomycetota bacterium]
RAEYGKALDLAKEKDITLFEAERTVLGLTDAQVGAVLLEIWKLNPEQVGHVMHQENPAAGGEFAAGAAYNLIASVFGRVLRLGDSGDHHLPHISQQILDIAHIEAPQWPRLLDLTADEAKRASVFHEM